MTPIVLNYEVSGEDFTRAGEASSAIKNKLKQIGIAPNVVRNVAIAPYEGGGGKIAVTIDSQKITIVISDTGKGIPDVALAMQEGYTTAPDDVRSLGFGAGMGLPNMKKYSDNIDVQSEVGKGTTVTMEFNLS